MVRKTAGRVSVEERQAAAAALHESIAVQVEALKASGEWERFLAFAGAFHTYSLSNVLLILSQCPTATKVAGFRKWQGLGRQVRRGEKSIRIFGYRTVKADADDGETAVAPAADTEGKAGIGVRGSCDVPDGVRVRHRPNRPHRPERRRPLRPRVAA